MGRVARQRRVAASLLLLMLALPLVLAPVAVADGDPASDVLLGLNVFYPYSPPVSASLQKSLNAETAAARRARFPIKVALIASPVDLGAIPALFGKPKQYASFLDQEISFGGPKPPLLVVMPAGYGVSGLSGTAAAAVASLTKPRTAASNDLARAAILAVPSLAAAAGHPLATVRGSSSAPARSGSPVATIVIVALACVAIAAGVLLFRRRLSASRRYVRSNTGPAAARRRARGGRSRPGSWR